MKSFLENTAEYLLGEYHEKLSETWIVFPNRRAALYFNRYLSEKIQKPLMAPRYFTISELMQQLSGLTATDNLFLLIELFGIYKKLTGSKQTFDEFYFYAETILADFDDLDKYQVKAEDLYQNLANIKSIDSTFEYLTEEQIKCIREFWDTFQVSSFSDTQKEFLSFWEVLFRLYQEFNSNLDRKNLAYEGKIYRKAIDNIDVPDNFISSSDKIIFIGFNALNKCEEILFQKFQQLKKAEFYWDYDKFYIENEYHEAGYFLRRYIRKFPSPGSYTPNNKTDIFNTEITLISVPSKVGQTKIIESILKSVQSDISDLNQETAIILADEKLLIPVLHSIPDEIQHINVSMGYPAQNSVPLNFVNIFIDLHMSAKYTNAGNVYYYHMNVLELLSHTYLVQTNAGEITDFIQTIKKFNKVYIPEKELQSLSAFSHRVFQKTNSAEALVDHLIDINHYLLDKERTSESGIRLNAIEKEIFIRLYTYLLRLKDLLKQAEFELSLNIVSRLLKKFFAGVSVPFSGEPLEGLQVMGLLETRAIDFKNVIILSLNEGDFPKFSNVPSFIPYNLRKGFQLPTPEHQDSIFSYYFYRLLHRTEQCYLVYNSSQSDTFSGEKSRFITQLELDPRFNIKKINYAYTIKALRSKQIVIHKHQEITDRLYRYINPDEEKYLSPSAINTYINCGLKFYLRYIEDLKPAEEIEEDIASNIFGSILHKAIYLLYSRKLTSEITKPVLQELLKEEEIISNFINQAVDEEYFKNEKQHGLLEEGRILLLKEVVKKYIRQVIETDKQYTPFTLLGLEQKNTASVEFELNNKKHSVKLGGIIDRLDTDGEIIRIIDYKTGQKKLSTPDIDKLFDNLYTNRNEAVFQTLLYCLILSEKYSDEKLQPNLYFIRDVFNYQFDTLITINKKRVLSYSDVRDLFEEKMKKLMSELFDNNIPFAQTSNKELCKYCEFNLFCHR